MKNKFGWYLECSKQELDNIWKNGILTVDANVLLDLYRYHEGTRDSLIQGIKKFEGSKWLSHQAASEFFRNRHKVIVSSEKAFKEAEDQTKTLASALDSAVAQLRGNRIIPKAIAENLLTKVQHEINSALKDISHAKEGFPNFLRDDPILPQLLDIFDGAVGSDFSEDEKPEMERQAKQRVADKVPPGYLDDGKPDDRPSGDFFLWRQVMDHAKKEARPILLVTSERKEDWWEKISAKTTGPRPELLLEGMTYSGQKILIYRTEAFLKLAFDRSAETINQDVMEEIRVVSARRSELENATKLLEQAVSESNRYKNAGTLSVELRRPVRNFTVSGHLNPNMDGMPNIRTRLLAAPAELPAHSLRARTGTRSDFNIHIFCKDTESRLPVGCYEFDYDASCVDDIIGEKIIIMESDISMFNAGDDNKSEGEALGNECSEEQPNGTK